VRSLADAQFESPARYALSWWSSRPEQAWVAFDELSNPIFDKGMLAADHIPPAEGTDSRGTQQIDCPTRLNAAASRAATGSQPANSKSNAN